MGWVNEAPDLAGLDAETTTRLNTLTPMDVPKGAVLFSPGDSVKGYVVVLSGKVNVSLTGATGREILLYEVAPGQSCIQSTLGLLGGDDYTAEAVAESDSRLVLLPRALFMDLLDASQTFRALVFTAFAGRMQTMMQLLEKVAFQRVECRLAAHLLAHSDTDGTLTVTQQDLATAVGSAREVISRRLDAWSRRGWVKTGRSTLQIIDTDALQTLADEPM
ncbi:MAG TPA: Crp/Fnr family transcriptional regulator [Rhodobacteraceae bacterium]|nr:Crp/Fnr family transcriptional regulator [Paracoccaceae bacterium]